MQFGVPSAAREVVCGNASRQNQLRRPIRWTLFGVMLLALQGLPRYADRPIVSSTSLGIMNEISPDQHRRLPLPPVDGTVAAADYFNAARREFRFFHFIIDTVLSRDYVSFVARKALDGQDDYQSVTPTDLARTAPGPGTKFIRENRQLLLEMFVARLVDNFQKYLVDLVRTVLRAKPQMLSTKQQTVTLEEILKHSKLDDLVHDVIERRVNGLSYEGFGELQAWCAERGLDIRVSDADKPQLIELIATRNVIAHNRGCVDERYLKAVPHTSFVAGAVRAMEVDDLFEAMHLLHTVVGSTDEAAAQKFGLLRAAILPEPVPVAAGGARGDVEQANAAAEPSASE